MNNYAEANQKALISMLLNDVATFSKVQPILKREYFEDRLRESFDLMEGFYSTERHMPPPQLLSAATGITFDDIPTAAQSGNWTANKIEAFCRQRAMENVILDGPDLLLTQGGEAIFAAKVKEASAITLARDVGISFFDGGLLERLERLKDVSRIIPTGWTELDFKLFGGLTPGSLSIFAGGSGTGKSLFLQNLAINWALAGKNVIYVTLELSEELSNSRMASIISGHGTRAMMADTAATAQHIGHIAPKAGDLRIKRMPVHTTEIMLRAYVSEYEAQTGHKPDALIVDYLDRMAPNNPRIDITNIFNKDQCTSEELRELACDLDIPIVTAAQLNRTAVDAETYDHSHIAGGKSKVDTADNVFGIRTNAMMREKGYYEIEFMKTRTSDACGMKIKLGYDSLSMRISNYINNEPGTHLPN